MTPQLGEHFFRHEYGRLVAMLSRRVGMRHLEMVEDSVQCALLAALESWTRVGVPENPSAWLFRVAHNHVVGELRQRARRANPPNSHGLASYCNKHQRRSFAPASWATARQSARARTRQARVLPESSHGAIRIF